MSGNDDENYDFRSNNVAYREETGTPDKKRTNNQFQLTDLPPDDALYDDDELSEMEDERRKQLEDASKSDDDDNDGTVEVVDGDVSDISDVDLLNDMVFDKEGQFSKAEYARNKKQLMSKYEYDSIPRIPLKFRGAPIIGLRTSAAGNINTPIGPLSPKKKFREIWDVGLTDVEKYVLMLISEHRHMTAEQLAVFVIMPTEIRHFPEGGHNTVKTYYEWVTKVRYECPLDYKETFKTSTSRGLGQKLDHLIQLRLIDKIIPSYKVRKNDSAEFNSTPSLYTEHYYLTPDGAKALIINTAAVLLNAKDSDKAVGYVPSYRSAAYTSIVHETECNEVMCSLIENAEYLSNIDAYGMRDDGDTRDYGTFDVARFYHEKDCEEKYVPFHDPIDMKDKTTDFKTDGKVVLYAEQLGEFIDYYLEYDSGSSSASKIKHKVEAFTRYIMWKKAEDGDRFRLPVLLLVSQNPGYFMPNLRGKGPTRYTRGIQTMMEREFSNYDGNINDIVHVLVADSRMIRMHGTMGACWHRIDMNTGLPSEMAYDLIEASKPVVAGR